MIDDDNDDSLAGFPVLGHSGASYGYRAFVVLVPSLKAGVFVVMTGDDTGYLYRGPLISLLLDHVMGVTPWVNASVLCSFPQPWQPSRNQPTVPPYDTSRALAHNLTAYVGTYVNPGYGRLDIRLRHNGKAHGARLGRSPRRVQLELVYGYGTWDLIPMAPHATSPSRQTADADPSDLLEYFYGKGSNVTQFIDTSPIIVHPPPTGSAVIVRITVPGFETRIPPVFWRYEATSGGISWRGRDRTVLVYIMFWMLLCCGLRR